MSPHPSSAICPSDSAVIEQTQAYVQAYMSHYDCSHDWTHIQRVRSLTEMLLTSERQLHPGIRYNTLLVTLGALLHDVGDKKYLEPGQDASTAVSAFLLSINAPPRLASAVQQLVLHVSFSFEKANSDAVHAMLRKVPELGIVQDADRLDAIGAVGIARCFAFTGAKGKGGLKGAIEHFEEKLVGLEGMMKTESGRRLARERTDRLRVFMGWWEEEEVVDDGKAEV
ncbi:hypothetical protein BU26DRAFT_412940 [Trematosphaeria pertusa]|uniref:HD/PDEase domain-containing protein n=1 Tax=Trematosphaeria pertusa TaxID=390896 RepID=A0A6A6J248_9PLEO|nr:uncharacterized protein BU26DRAFT_412940 [Trematosphaeria pertusa]KAF2256417.1 hypothetical protein BU26DRAFT_412940 [Trematosphaeria pertusa]